MNVHRVLQTPMIYPSMYTCTQHSYRCGYLLGGCTSTHTRIIELIYNMLP